MGALLMKEIKRYMSDPLSVISGQQTVAGASKLMRELGSTALLIENGSGVKGIITETDVVRKVIAEDLDPQTTIVSKAMSSPLYSLESDQNMEEAFVCMYKHQIRHVSITENGKVVGMLSIKNFASYYHEKYGKRMDPIDEFWNNYDCLLDANSFMSQIAKLLTNYRGVLEESSLTASAIDQSDPLVKIKQYAKMEGHDDLADILDLVEKNEIEEQNI